jgi:hypothetical protein
MDEHAEVLTNLVCHLVREAIVNRKELKSVTEYSEALEKQLNDIEIGDNMCVVCKEQIVCDKVHEPP